MVMREGVAIGMKARIVGSGKESIVLAHGYGGDQSVWDKVLPLLATRYRVLVFDWCFSGAADPSLYDPQRYTSYDAFVEDLICVVEEMKLKRSVFVGHSMSGMIGCLASLKRPDLFTRLLLVGASPRFVNNREEGYEGGFEMEEIEEVFKSIESNYDQWASGFASLVVDASDPHSVDKFANSLKAMGPQVALPMAKTVFLADYRHILPKLLLPCHIIQTRNDAVVPLSVAHYMHAHIKAAHIHIIDDTDGHFPQLTAHLHFLHLINTILP